MINPKIADVASTHDQSRGRGRARDQGRARGVALPRVQTRTASPELDYEP